MGGRKKMMGDDNRGGIAKELFFRQYFKSYSPFNREMDRGKNKTFFFDSFRFFRVYNVFLKIFLKELEWFLQKKSWQDTSPAHLLPSRIKNL